MSIRIELEIESKLDTVWEAWILSDKVAQWFAPAAKVEPRVGGKSELYFDPTDEDRMSTKGCKILQFETMKMIKFEWKGPDQFAALMNQTGELTSVEVTFHSFGKRTIISLIHVNWKYYVTLEDARIWNVHAWYGVLSNLKTLLESEQALN